jgi:hypothetical protein
MEEGGGPLRVESTLKKGAGGEGRSRRRRDQENRRAGEQERVTGYGLWELRTFFRAAEREGIGEIWGFLIAGRRDWE